MFLCSQSPAPSTVLLSPILRVAHQKCHLTRVAVMVLLFFIAPPIDAQNVL